MRSDKRWATGFSGADCPADCAAAFLPCASIALRNLGSPADSIGWPPSCGQNRCLVTWLPWRLRQNSSPALRLQSLRLLASGRFKRISALVQLLSHVQKLLPVALVLDNPSQPSEALRMITHVLNFIGHGCVIRTPGPRPQALLSVYWRHLHLVYVAIEKAIGKSAFTASPAGRRGVALGYTAPFLSGTELTHVGFGTCAVRPNLRHDFEAREGGSRRMGPPIRGGWDGNQI